MRRQAGSGIFVFMDEMRDRLIDAAYDLFAEVGPSRASLGEIAERVGAEEAAIRALFVDRRGLLAAVLDERTTPLIGAASVLMSEHEDFRQLLPRMLRLIHQFLVDEPRYARIIAWTALEGGELLGAVFARSFFPSDFHDRLLEAIDRGELRVRSAMTAIMLLDSLLMFPQFVRSALSAGLPAEVDVETLFDDYFADVLRLLEGGVY
jgi:AcrR family transcriptional regulator